MGCFTCWSSGYSYCSGRLYLVWRVTISNGGTSDGLRNGGLPTKWQSWPGLSRKRGPLHGGEAEGRCSVMCKVDMA